MILDHGSAESRVRGAHYIPLVKQLRYVRHMYHRLGLPRID